MNGQNDWAAIADRYAEITRQIESLLRVRDLMGGWTGSHLERYRALCADEGAALERMGELVNAPRSPPARVIQSFATEGLLGLTVVASVDGAFATELCEKRDAGA